MPSTTRAWIPLISIGVAYVGFLAGVGALALVSTPEYQHVSYLKVGLIALAWSLLALVSIAVSGTSLILTFKQLPLWLRLIVATANVPVLIASAGLLLVSVYYLQTYRAGLAAYETAVHVCGHPPVLASAGWGGDVLNPNDSDYERLKYSTEDPSILGTYTYFCTLADAEARGYKRQSWHDIVPCSATGCPVAAFFASPLQYPGHPWKRNGIEVPASEIVAAAGPAHCGWESATFLNIGWPLGTRPQTAAGSRQFIRDPNHVLPRSLPLDLHATLPADARPTGYTYGDGVALYLSPSDQDRSVYLVGSTVERWPRSDPMTLCQ
jgi:hypothetical protein